MTPKRSQGLYAHKDFQWEEKGNQPIDAGFDPIQYLIEHLIDSEKL